MMKLIMKNDKAVKRTASSRSPLYHTMDGGRKAFLAKNMPAEVMRKERSSRATLDPYSCRTLCTKDVSMTETKGKSKMSKCGFLSIMECPESVGEMPGSLIGLIIGDGIPQMWPAAAVAK